MGNRQADRQGGGGGGGEITVKRNQLESTDNGHKKSKHTTTNLKINTQAKKTNQTKHIGKETNKQTNKQKLLWKFDRAEDQEPFASPTTQPSTQTLRENPPPLLPLPPKKSKKSSPAYKSKL